MIVCAVLVATAASASPDQVRVPFRVDEVREGVVFIRRFTPRAAEVTGSGYIAESTGLIFTNRHVVVPDDPRLTGTRLFVGVPRPDHPDDLNFFEAAIVKTTDPHDALDFAVLKVDVGADRQPLPALVTEPGSPRLGESVAVIGYPYGPVLSFNRGFISATRVLFDGVPFYQTDAAVNPGNSGGPLLNRHGAVLGTVTRKRPQADNMGYASTLGAALKAMPMAMLREAAGAVNPPIGRVPSSERFEGRRLTMRPEAWRLVNANVRHVPPVLQLHRHGEQFWIAGREPLPADFQLDVVCHLGYQEGRARPYGGHRSLCVRFGTDDIDSPIMKAIGVHLRYSSSELVLSRDGQMVARVGEGNRGRCRLSITLVDRRLTVVESDQILLEHLFEAPVDASGPFCLGGYLARMTLQSVAITDLDRVASEASPSPRREDVPPPDGD